MDHDGFYRVRFSIRPVRRQDRDGLTIQFQRDRFVVVLPDVSGMNDLYLDGSLRDQNDIPSDDRFEPIGGRGVTFGDAIKVRVPHSLVDHVTYIFVALAKHDRVTLVEDIEGELGRRDLEHLVPEDPFRVVSVVHVTQENDEEPREELVRRRGTHFFRDGEKHVSSSARLQSKKNIRDESYMIAK